MADAEKDGIEIDQVSFSRKGRPILNRVDLKVGRRELVGLIGPNGAGKSSLLKLLVKLLTPGAGTIRVDGKELNEFLPRELARRIAYLPQEPAIESPFPCREVVLMGRYAHLGRFARERAEDCEIVREAMRLTETTAFADRPVTELSGGELQRVLIARTLAQEAKYLLLDEPTANLDPQHQLGAIELVVSLVEKGISVLMALHDLHLAARYCHRLVLIHQGRVIAEGTPRAVLTEENLRRVYGIEAEVTLHPTLHYPVVTPLAVTQPEG
ncbi:MAG TPA: heme ABC transporter ATP-binding protein [Candidatus Manganitrophaceae bacterium]|nr:heme ABC transporter ATP-binding protein [Candidatus Manganitrophaceae bacterium]